MRALAGIVVLLLGACATSVTPEALGGSRSGGTVVMGYEFSVFQRPNVDWSQAGASAGDKCRAWGYRGAEAFGGQAHECISRNGQGLCNAWRVTASFQCVP